MVYKEQHIVDEYLKRAETVEESTANIPREVAENGEERASVLPVLERTYESSRFSSQAKNRKATKRRISPFSLVALLFSAAIVVVFYISNILAVDHLLRQINTLQQKHQQLCNEQELLRARIHRLSSFERVQQIARSQLGMTFPQEAPRRLEIDGERANEASELLREMMLRGEQR